MAALAQTIATFCIGAFFAVAAYISLVQHPATLEAGTDVGARFFPPMYARASVMQATLAFFGTLAAIWAYLATRDILWVPVALLIGSVIPFTLLVINSVNNELTTGGPPLSSARARELLVRWGHLHWFRTVASALGFLSCLYSVYAQAA